MQRAMDQVSQSCDNYDLTIRKKKEAVHQPAPVKPYNEPIITVNGQKLKVDKSNYLGSTLSRAVHIDDVVTARIAKKKKKKKKKKKICGIWKTPCKCP